MAYSKLRSGGFVAGALAGLLAAGVAAIGRFTLGTPTYFDLTENFITRVTPTVAFAFLLDRLQFSAKPLLFLAVVVLQILIGGALGAAFVRLVAALARPVRQPIGLALLLAATLWLLTEIALAPLLGLGFFATRSLAGPTTVGITLAITYAVYGVALGMQLKPIGEHLALSERRRRLVGGLAASATALALGLFVYRSREPDRAPGRTGEEDLTLGPTIETAAYPLPPTPPEWSIPGLAAPITATSDFYVVTKNLFGDPKLDSRNWELRLDGLVQTPLRLDYASLLRFPAVERYQTLECISNLVGGGLISTAWWRGVRLADLLRMAGPDSHTVKVVFHAADGYADSLPFAIAVQLTPLLIYQMNGQPLRPEHGFPLRLLVPGLYGLKNVKWITRIELVRDDFQGYWQERGWTDTAKVQTTSRVDVPLDHARISAGRVTLAGVAFAGDRGIRRVQVTVDHGQTWQDADLEPPLGPFTWTRWRSVAVLRPGAQTISVRATDGTGQVQWAFPQDTVPDGATGTDTHVITVTSGFGARPTPELPSESPRAFLGDGNS